MRTNCTTILIATIVFTTFHAGYIANAAQTRLSILPHESGSANLIGFLQREHVADCGCTYFLTTNPSDAIFSADFGDQVWMNIDGSDVPLTLVSTVTTPRGRTRRAQRTISKYSGPGIIVTLESVPGKSHMEGSDNRGSITVTKGSRTQSVRHKGYCGC